MQSPVQICVFPPQGGQEREGGSLDLGGRDALVPGIRFSAWPGVDSSPAAGLLKEDLQRGWFPGSRGFPGARLLQAPMHGQPPHPHLHPGSQAPHPVGTQNFVYHPCQVPGTPKWSQVHYLF